MATSTLTSITYETSTVIDWSPMLGFDCQLILGSWDQGLTAVTNTADGVESLDLCNLGDWLLENPSEPIKNWRDTIPKDILAALNQVPDRRLELLQWAQANPYARDLLCSTPLLLWLLVDVKNEERDRLLTKKQVTILGALGFEGSKQQIRALRLFGSLQPPRKLLLDLVPLLENQACLHYWSHTKDIGMHSLESLVAYPWLADCPAKALIEHMADNRTRRLFSDTLGMLDDLERLRQCKTVRSLARLHDQRVAVLNRYAEFRHVVRDANGDMVALPDAPLEETDDIVYLSTQQDVVNEGRQMRHCIASYLSRIAEGQYFVYHYQGESALTIGISAQNGQLRLDDVRGRSNASPDADAMQKIEVWFTQLLVKAKA